MNKFSNNTINQIGSYVYRLVDPKNGETFYVGKGKGNRVFEHASGKLKSKKPNDKVERIKRIKQEGLEVIHIIQRWGLTDEEAMLVESVVIDCFPGLTNIQGGYDNDHGVINTKTLEKMFSLEPYDEPDFNYILIKIQQKFIEKNIDKEDPVYETVRYAWKLNMDKANKCKYVFAVVDGIVEGVFEVDEWKYVPERDNRLEFVGKRAKDLEEIYVGKKRIPEYYRKKGLSNPALYGKNFK